AGVLVTPGEAGGRGAPFSGGRGPPGRGAGGPRPPAVTNGDSAPADVDLAAVSEAEMAEALDKIERETGYTLTGPVRELVSTQIVNVLSKSLGVVARNDEGREVVVYLLPRNGEVPMQHTNDFGTDTSNQSGVEIKVMSGESDSPEPLDCQDV